MTLPLGWLLGAELAVIFGILTIIGLIRSWRHRRRQTEALTELLERLERKAPERCEHYSQWLESHCGLDKEQALVSATAWLEAEKKFWRHFITWQLQPNPSLLPRISDHLYQYVDEHLDILAEALGTSVSRHPGAPTEASSTSEEAVTTNDVNDAIATIESNVPSDSPQQEVSSSEEEEEMLVATPEIPLEETIPTGTSQTIEDDEDVVILSDQQTEKSLAQEESESPFMDELPERPTSQEEPPQSAESPQ